MLRIRILCEFALALLIIGEGGRLLAVGDLNTGSVITIIFAIVIGAFSLGSIGAHIETFAKASAAVQKIFEILGRIPSIDSLLDNGEKPDGIKGNIELKNVNFIYPARPERVSLFLSY